MGYLWKNYLRDIKLQNLSKFLERERERERERESTCKKYLRDIKTAELK